MAEDQVSLTIATGSGGQAKRLRTLKVTARIARAKLLYGWFRLTHPGKNYAQFYAWFNSRQLAGGIDHMSLRTVETGDPATDRFKSKSRALTDEVFSLLIDLGLSAEKTCVDYGCGSLRIGEKLIDFLAPDRYIGFDITDAFFKAGLKRLDPALVAAKRPRTFVIGPDTLASARRDPPDFVFSFAVIQHVPPGEFYAFFDAFVSLIGPNTRGVLFFRASPTIERYHETSWSYPAGWLSQEIRRRRPGIALRHVKDGWSQVKYTNAGYDFLVLN